METSIISANPKISQTIKDIFQVAPGVWGMKIVFVNIYMVQTGKGWVLIDAGLKGTAQRILDMAWHLFGKESKPECIVLTHGHFDHIGALKDLLEQWNVPVYAHVLEAPFLTGISSYPPADPLSGGGAMALMSWMFPRNPINISDRLIRINEYQVIPALPEWEVIHTPGHSPGHISLYRIKDKTLVAGDAFVTTQQESAYSVITQKKLLCGPPRYFTIDWQKAFTSIHKLVALEPEIAATGHGRPMHGHELREALEGLLLHFRDRTIPSSGRYAAAPAISNEDGVQYVPPPRIIPMLIAGLVISAVAFLSIYIVRPKLFRR